MKKLQSITAICLLLLLATSCTSTHITHNWKNPKLEPRQMHKILVLGIRTTMNPETRKKMEDHMVGDLQRLGYDAVSSLNLYGKETFAGMNEYQVMGQLKNIGVDGVLTIVLINKKETNKYVPGKPIMNPGPSATFWEYRSSLLNRAYEQGHVISDVQYFWESNLYQMPAQELAYSVQTHVFNAEDEEKMADEYGHAIVRDMRRNGLLKNKHQNTTPKLH